jgi:hypothetical protein
MTEVDMLVRDTLTDRADAAPNGAGLLARVHTRSRLFRRRRRVGAAGAGVAAVLLGVAGVPVVSGLLPGDGGGVPESVGGPAASLPSGSKSFGTDRASDAPTSPPPAFTVVLGPPRITLPTVPFTPPTGVVDGLAPAVAMFDGRPMIMHSPEGGSDGKPMLMLYIGATSEAGLEGTTVPVKIRGVDGTLLKPTSRSHPGVQLTWTEPDGTAMLITAGNITDDQVVAYANGLRKADLPVLAPFSFTLLPEGMELDNVGPSDMLFKVPGQPSSADFGGKLGFLLNAEGGQDAASWPLLVGGRRAQFSPQDDGGRVLQVSQPNGYVLQIQVPANLTISDDDIKRMAAGVTVNSGAKGGRG